MRLITGELPRRIRTGDNSAPGTLDGGGGGGGRMAGEKHLVGYCALCCKRAQFIRVDPFRLVRQLGPTGSARERGGKSARERQR